MLVYSSLADLDNTGFAGCQDDVQFLRGSQSKSIELAGMSSGSDLERLESGEKVRSSPLAIVTGLYARSALTRVKIRQY